ncbi:hypothetical protein BH23BAC4_BH23BAC4_11730 [soil metagenome]
MNLLLYLQRAIPGTFIAVLIALVFAGCFPTQQASSNSPARLTLANQANGSVHYVYISPCRSNNWGPDQLGNSETVGRGTRRTFTVPAGCFDLRARMGDGRDVERRGAQFRAGQEYVWTLST